MTPARAIGMLDRQIASHGQPVTLRRIVANAPAIETTVAAFVRGYRPDELVAGINQGDTMITISPSALVGSVFESAIPKRGDKVIVDGRVRNVEMANPVSIAGEHVRFNLQVRG